MSNEIVTTSTLKAASHSVVLRLFADKPRTALLLILAFGLLIILPFFHLLPESSGLYLSAYWVTLVGKIMCFALVALALDLVWGYAGILSLGHGLYFALGGYCFGMYLMRQTAGDTLPDFMVFLDWHTMPWFWSGTQYFAWSLLLVLSVPAIVAGVFGYFAFRSKIKGVYFSIITQAMTYAAALLFFMNETGFGGNNGFTGFTKLLGYSITAPTTRVVLCSLTALVLLLSFIGLRHLLTSPFGRVLQAIRDSENRLQFLGYRTLWYKLTAWVISAVLAGIAGALYVPQVGIINPSEMGVTNSIEMAVWVAIGGRGTLVGPLIGAGLVNAAKSYFTVAYPEVWLLLLGTLFIVVTMYMPKGIIGLGLQIKEWIAVKKITSAQKKTDVKSSQHKEN